MAFWFIPGRRASSAFGYAQVLDGTWREYIKVTGDGWRSRTSFADSVDFIQYYLTRARRENGIDKRDSFNFYINYHEGIVGYRRKNWKDNKRLRATASKVAERSKRYAGQYAKCKGRLDRSWLQRLMGS